MFIDISNSILTLYAPVYTTVLVGLVRSIVIITASYRMTTDDIITDEEKLSAYECGFTPHGLARMPFDIRFYLVAILFIVFDLETCYMLPWIITLGEQSAWGFWTMIDFMVELLVGYMYAWKIGALEWE